MCGILGFFDSKMARGEPARLAVGRAMGQSLSHRGPDDEGLWQDAAFPLLLGHRRLSILDLSPEGHQPMVSGSGRYVIVFNGEIYNFLSLRQDLERAGHTFRGRSDTEIMLAAFEHWGVNEALQKLDGMFAFVLWDKQTKHLHLVRDRLGKKPLYVGWARTGLVFASELKAFHAHPEFEAHISRDVLALYMRFGYVPAPHSIYEAVWQLLPGSRLALNMAELPYDTDLSALMEPYWSLPRVVEEARYKIKPLSDAQAVDNFEALLRDCVAERMVSDVPLGAFLSGGLDSSVVVALMQQLSPRPVKTFTIGFQEGSYNEAAHAHRIADHLGTEHHELYLSGRDALDIIPLLPDMYDEPFADASQIPTYLVSRFARQQVTVALSGDGGDEALGGYVRHFTLPAFWARVGWMPKFTRQALAGVISSVSVERWNKMVPQQPQFGERIHKLGQLLPAGTADDAYIRLLSQWSNPAQLVRGAQEPRIPLTDPACQPQGLSFAESMMFKDALSYLPNDVLVKVDRASMAASMECRAPLLDRKIVEASWQLPPEMKIRDGKGKWILRQILARHVPASLFDRPKQGFSVPVSAWLRGPLQGWAEDLIKSVHMQDYLDAPLVQKIWDEHKAGTVDHGNKLWTILMFEAWLKRWH